MKVVKTIDVIVVGAGSAGIGVAVVLKRMGINFQILEKEEVGASFKKWPEETQFISPSFTGNFFKMPDLNAFKIESAMKMVAGTARSMGIQVQGEFPHSETL